MARRDREVERISADCNVENLHLGAARSENATDVWALEGRLVSLIGCFEHNTSRS